MRKLKSEILNALVPALLLLALFPRPAPAQEPRPPAASSPEPETTDHKPQTDLYGDPLPPGAVARLGTVRLRHGETVRAVAFSPDGKALASASDDRTVRLWDVSSGNETRNLQGHEAAVTCLTFSPDGSQIAFGSEDRTIRIWDRSTGGTIHLLQGHEGKINSIASAPDGRVLVSGSDDKTIRLWNMANGAPMRTLETESEVLSVAFSPDGKLLASGNGSVTETAADHAIRLWDVATGNRTRSLEEPTRAVTGVAFSPDGTKLAASCWDGWVRVWDAASGTLQMKLDGKISTVSVTFAPEGKALVSGNGDGEILVWDASGGGLLWTVHAGGSPKLAFSPDGRLLASSGSGPAPHLWDVASGQAAFSGRGHDREIISIAASPDGAVVATAGTDNTIRLWTPATGNELARIEVRGYLRRVAFSPDGRLLAAGVHGKGVGLFDAATGKSLRWLGGGADWVEDIAFSPDGRCLATGCRSSPVNQKTIQVWDVAAGKLLNALNSEEVCISHVLFSPDGETLATLGWRDVVRVWNVGIGKEQYHVAGRRFVAFSPDGKTLATGWETSSGGHTQTGILLLDAATGAEITRIAEDDGDVIDVRFSTDGTLLAGAVGGMVRVWSAAYGRRLLSREGHRGTVNAVAFPSNGRTLVSASNDSTVLVWEIPPLDWTPGLLLAERSPRFLEDLWDILGSADSKDHLEPVYRATWTLAALALDPSETTRRETAAFLKAHVEMSLGKGEALTRKFPLLIAQLDDDQFEVREKATRELVARGTEAEGALRQALKEAPSPEVRTRIKHIVLSIQTPDANRVDETARRLRCIAALEHMGTAVAHDLLEQLAHDSPSPRERREARAALERLSRRLPADEK